MFRTGSIFKNAQPKSASDKKDWYLDIQPSTQAPQIAAASISLLAINWATKGAGTIALLPLANTGKRDGALAQVGGHSNAILDVQFSPFDARCFATGSEDCTVKVWQAPEDDDSLSSTNQVSSLSGHKRGVTCVRFNPSVREILASGSNDGTVRIWNSATESELQCVELGEKSAVEAISWSPDGTKLAVVAKDKKLRIIDARNGSVEKEADAHQGVKASRCVWLGNTGRIATSGFSKMRERQLMVWDMNNLEKPLKTHGIDTSTGVMNLAYDEDAGILFVCGTGDSSIRAFDMLQKKPWLAEMAAARSDKPAKGFCLLPKRAVQVMQCEVDRVFRVQADSIVPISYVVPRKSKRSFSEIAELFPDTRGSEPSASAEEWSAGGVVPQVTRVSMDPASDAASSVAAQSAAPSTLKTAARPAVNVIRSDRVKNVDRSITSAETGKIAAVNIATEEELAAKRAAAEAKANVVSAKTLAARALIRSTHFRHISGKQVKPESQFFGMRASASAGYARQIIANKTYFAIPLEGNGGALGIVRHCDVGRQPLDISRVENGATLCDFDFSPHNDNLVLCALDNARIKVFSLPDKAKTERLEGLLCDATVDLTGHRRKLSTARWHPTVSDLIVSTATDNSLRVFDVTAGKEALCINDAHTDPILSCTFDYQGQTVATSSKDRRLRLLDPRSGKVVAVSEIGHAGAKAFQCAWMGRHDRIFTAGFSKSSEREVAVWDIRAINKWMGKTQIDVSSGVVEPIYDEDTNVAFVAGRGDTSINMYEPVEKPHFLTRFSGGDPAVGVAALPKTCVDVRGVELRHMVKLTSSGKVVPIIFKVPRTRDEFFQDDIYPPTRAGKASLQSSEWLEGKNADPVLFDMCPSDMTRLSDAPPIEKKAPKYKLELDQEEEKEVTDEVWARMNKLKGLSSIEDAAMAEQEGVSDSEWSE